MPPCLALTRAAGPDRYRATPCQYQARTVHLSELDLTRIISDEPSVELELVESERHPAVVNERESIANDVAGLRSELDRYYVTMRGFKDLSLEEVFMSLAGFSARASEIRTNLIRQDRRAFHSFRTGEIDPFLTEVDRQFKFWSRLQSVREMEFKMTGPIT